MAWLIPLTIFLIPAYLHRFDVAGIPTTTFEVLLYICAIGVLIIQPISLTVDRLKPMLRRYGPAIALFVIGAIIGLVISPDKRIALGLFKAYIFDPLLLFSIIVAWADSPLKQQRIIYSFIASGFLLAMSAILGPRSADGRAVGLYALDVTPSPNFLALYLGPIVGLVLGLTVGKQPKIFRIVLIITGFLMAIAIAVTGSRGAILALTFGVSLVIIRELIRRADKSMRQNVRIASVAFLVLLAAGAFWFAKPDFSQNASHRAATSNNLRYEIWRTTVVDIIPPHFVTGIGLGNYQAHFTELTENRPNFPEYIAPWARTPHNIFLNVWVNLGLLGVVGLVWLLYIFFIDLWPKRKSSPLHFALLIAMVTLLIHGLVDAAYWKNDLSALFWILLALGYVATPRDDPKDIAKDIA